MVQLFWVLPTGREFTCSEALLGLSIGVIRAASSALVCASAIFVDTALVTSPLRCLRACTAAATTHNLNQQWCIRALQLQQAACVLFADMGL